ncbi:MAG: hypothetical protein PHE03_13840 [Bacteroidales bacterium]|nr:hypothetical protein [Bacteroidales bacterium]MDD3893368.1 hypothetical protein [Bacteroidales bacterium]
MTSGKFDIEYNKWLKQVDVDASDSVWNEIQDELDFIETWDNISSQLDVVKPQKGRIIAMKYLKPFAAVAAVILLMLLPVKYLTDQVIQPIIISEQHKEESKIEELILDETTPIKKRQEGIAKLHAAEVDIPTANTHHKNTLSASSENRLAELVEIEDAEDTALANERIAFDRLQTRPFAYNDFLATNDVVLPKKQVKKTHTYSEPKKSSDFTFRVVEIGLVYGYKNTWLLNHETFNGLDPKRLGNTLPTFHQDIGASSTLEFNNRHQVGLEFLWKSETGQNYQQYINASFVDKNINLNYLKFQAFYYWNSRKIPGHAILGGYIARLDMAEEQLEKTRFNIDDNYTNLDYGLLAGYQFNFALSNRVIIKPSVRVTYNLINIFSGDDIMPSHFKKTKNLAASFNVSLSYRLFK